MCALVSDEHHSLFGVGSKPRRLSPYICRKPETCGTASDPPLKTIPSGIITRVYCGDYAHYNHQVSFGLALIRCNYGICSVVPGNKFTLVAKSVFSNVFKKKHIQVLRLIDFRLLVCYYSVFENIFMLFLWLVEDRDIAFQL